jgi:hypothetical protein
MSFLPNPKYSLDSSGIFKREDWRSNMMKSQSSSAGEIILQEMASVRENAEQKLKYLASE